MKFRGKEVEIRPTDQFENNTSNNNITFKSLELKLEFENLYSEMGMNEKMYNAREHFQHLATVFDNDKVFLQVLADNNITEESFSKMLFDSLTKDLSLRIEVLSICEKYDEYCFKLYEQLKSLLPEIYSEFKHGVIDILDTIPDFSYDSNRIDDIINLLKICFLSSEFGQKIKYSARVSSTNKVQIILSNFKGIQEYKETLTHEFLHAISKDWNSIFSIKGVDNNKNNFGQQSIGFGFRGLEKTATRFIWLNEAFTENLAQQLVPTESGLHYPRERKLLSILNQKKKEGTNFDFNLLLKIYFRHLKTRESDEVTAIQEWREFSKETDNAFGPRFLVTLDIFIKKNSIQKAIEIIGNWPDGEPHIEDLKVQ
jgi:hypothetical protein